LHSRGFVSHSGLKRVLIGLAAVVLVLVVGCGIFLATNYKNLGNLAKVVVLIKTQYLSPVNYNTLVDGAIKGMVDSLNDPYSVYLDPSTYKRLQEQIKGSFGGLGILVGVRDEYLTVMRTYSGTPAFLKGVAAGDLIYKIDNQDVRGLDLDTAIQMMRGPVGTKVKLTLVRANVANPFEVELTREEIVVPTVESKMLKGKIAYISIAQFNEKTPEEIKENIDSLKKQDMRGIILDIRNNPGGELMSVVKVADYFVPAGPVVYIEYRGGYQEEHLAHGNNINLPLAVMINENSASAAEILAGAIKDTGSGILVGQKSFGKGVVQMVFNLDNGSGLKLTTARYLTPNKNDINKKGILPDVSVRNLPDGSDAQLQEAIDIINGKLAGKAA